MPFLKETNLAIWFQANYFGFLPSWLSQRFILTRIDAYSRCGFAFPACRASTSTTIQGFTECLIDLPIKKYVRLAEKPKYNSKQNKKQKQKPNHGIKGHIRNRNYCHAYSRFIYDIFSFSCMHLFGGRYSLVCDTYCQFILGIYFSLTISKAYQSQNFRYHPCFMGFNNY